MMEQGWYADRFTGSISIADRSKVSISELFGGSLDATHLRRYTLEDASLAREILGLFRGQLGHFLNQLDAATDPISWREAAHALKGSARCIGAWPLASMAEQAERSVDPTDADARKAAVQEVRALAHQLEIVIGRYLTESLVA